jgi:hypothetical protein
MLTFNVELFRCCIGRRPETPKWPPRGGVKDENIFSSLIFYGKNLFKHLSEL